MTFIERFRVVRSTYLGPFVMPLQKAGITANHLTLVSFLFGLLAVWFLFDNRFYFVLFGLLHLVVDSLDGVLARMTHGTAFGKYSDLLSDNTLVVLLFIKSYLVLGSPLYAGAAFSYAVMMVVYIISHAGAPVLFTRTLTFIGYSLNLFFLSGVVVAVAAIIALILQLHYHLTFFSPKK